MVSLATDNLELVILGTDRSFYHKSWKDSQGWQPSESDWNNIGGAFLYEPVVGRWGTGFFVFGVGLDSLLYYRHYDGKKWTADWQDLGQDKWLTRPAVASGYPKWFEVIIVGQDRKLAQLWYSGDQQKWIHASRWDSNIAFNYTPVLTNWDSNRFDIFCMDANRKMWHTWWVQGEGWWPTSKTFEDLGAPIFVGLQAVSTGPSRFTLFGLGIHGILYQMTFDGTKYSSWESLGGAYRGLPEPVSWGRNRIDVFVIGDDSNIYRKIRNEDGTWSSAKEEVGGQAVTDRVTAVSWGYGRVDLMILGKNSQIFHKKYTPQDGWAPSQEAFLSIGGLSISRVGTSS